MNSEKEKRPFVSAVSAWIKMFPTHTGRPSQSITSFWNGAKCSPVTYIVKLQREQPESALSISNERRVSLQSTAWTPHLHVPWRKSRSWSLSHLSESLFPVKLHPCWSHHRVLWDSKFSKVIVHCSINGREREKLYVHRNSGCAHLPVLRPCSVWNSLANVPVTPPVFRHRLHPSLSLSEPAADSDSGSPLLAEQTVCVLWWHLNRWWWTLFTVTRHCDTKQQPGWNNYRWTVRESSMLPPFDNTRGKHAKAYTAPRGLGQNEWFFLRHYHSAAGNTFSIIQISWQENICFFLYLWIYSPLKWCVVTDAVENTARHGTTRHTRRREALRSRITRCTSVHCALGNLECLPDAMYAIVAETLQITV